MPLGVGQRRDPVAVDGLVLADVDVARIVADVQIGQVGNVAKVLVLAARHDLGVAKDLGLLVGFLGPVASDDVVRLAVGGEVHEHRGKQQAVAALEEQDLVVVRNPHELAQIGLGGLDDVGEGGRSMAHLHDGHTGILILQHLVGCLLQHWLGQNCRAGGEIVNSCHRWFPSHHLEFATPYGDVDSDDNTSLLI